MSGGQLVVLDRLGRDVKRFPLAEGAVTLGSDHSCDIRFMLDTVDPHHATVAVHANQTVVRAVCGGTQVNGRAVSVAALRHGDVISIGGRQLRWDYARPDVRRAQEPLPALYVSRRKAARARRGSGPAAARRDPALHAALEMSHRASMPANAGGKQVAIVQPQRRDTSEQIDKPAPRTPHSSKRPRPSKGELDTSAEAKRGARGPAGSSPTKATLWIESRKASPRRATRGPAGPAGPAGPEQPRRASAAPRKSTPLRLTVLKRAQSARKATVTKIEAPAKIDHMKQAALLLMTGHTPKSKLLGQKTPSPRSPNGKLLSPLPPGSASLRRTTSLTVTPKSASPKLTPQSASPKSGGRRSASFVVKRKSSIRKSTPRGRASRGSARTATALNQTVSLLDTSSSAAGDPRRGSARRSARAPDTSPPLPSPRKSALKNPLAKSSMRKTESIKFDLSNLENERSQDSDVLILGDSTRHSHGSGDELALRYSDTSAASASPSPRRALHSRSSAALSPAAQSRTLTPARPAPRQASRGGTILQRALSGASYSRRSTKSVSLLSGAATPLAPRRTRTLSPRAVETYSIVDLVSIDSNASGRSASVYDSAVSDAGSLRGASRSTRSTVEPTLLGSSTPYVERPRRSGSRSSSASQSTREVSAVTSDDSTRFTDTGLLSGDTTRASVKSRVSTGRTRLSSNKSRVSVNGSRLARNRSRLSSGSSKLSNESAQSTSKGSTSSRRSKKSLSTPENASIPISVNSTRISRASRSRSRINDSDLLFVELDEADDSPRSSRRVGAAKRAGAAPRGGDESPGAGQAQDKGISTPENTHSPEEASTPVLSIQSLLDSSQSSIRSQLSRRGRPSLKRKTVGILSGPKIRVSSKSKSLNFSAQGSRRRLSDDSYENMNISERQDDEIVTPRSAVKPVQEAVKNKHSTAKKPQSKRSIIDDLNESAVMKQLFNSPVKRKLSQSMTELSRRQPLDGPGRPSRDDLLLALLAHKATPDDSLLERTEAFSPERFVSPLGSPRSPALDGVQRLFARREPADDLRDVRGVRALLRSPRDDLTDVAGVKAVFAASPRNRLSDVRVKEVFAPSPANDLRRVSGVKSLFRSQQERKSPRNSLGDVRGVKKLFTGRSPANDLRNVSGVKGTLRQSPRNDLSDVRGVKRLFRRDGRNDFSDMSGVEELFNESNNSHKDAESLFDQLVGRPTVRAVYSRTLSSKRKSAQKKSTPKSKSLLASLDISLNTEEWLKENLRMLQELRKQRAQKTAEPNSKSANKSKLNATRELQKLSTETVAGSSPLLKSRVRASTAARASPAVAPPYSSHTLPIKKRSLADASAHRSRTASERTALPIKKRAVLHSTPVKGRQLNLTMGAAELGRVSPIVAERPRRLEPDAPRSTIENDPTEVRPKIRRATKAPQSVVSPKTKNPSPAKTRGKSRVPTPSKTTSTPTKEKSPAKPKRAAPAKKAVSPVAKPASPKPVSPKSTRSRRAAPVSPKTDAKNGGAKLVVAKKSPVMSPQPRALRKRKEPDTLPTPKTTPKRSRAVRNNDEKVAEKPKTPKNTRAKVLKTTVAVVKPSPQLKPRATRRRANDSAAEKSNAAVEPKETRRVGTRETRQVGAKSKNIESPKKSPAPSPKKSRRQPPKHVAEEVAPKTRGRGKTALGNEQSADVEKSQPKTRRGRSANVEEAVAPKKARKADQQESIQELPKTVTKNQEKPEPKVTRGKKIVQQESASPELTTRSRRGAKPESTKPEVNTRKRKSDAPDERPAKVSKNTTKSVAGRGRSKKIESPKKETANVAKKAPAKQSKQTGKQAPGDVAKKTTRSKKAEVSLEVPKAAARSTRGKRNVTIEVAPEVGKRKRKPAVEPPQEARGSRRRR